MRRSTAVLAVGWLAGGAIALPMAGAARAVGTPKVVVIVLENKQYTGIVGKASAPYMNSLIDQGLFFTNYHAQVHGSAPNYRAMTAGVTPSPPPLTNNIFRSFDLAARDWTEFDESMTSNCGGPNNVKVPGTAEPLYSNGHDPAYMYRGNESCANNDVPLTSDAQLTALPEFTFIVPNQCDNMHTYARTGPCPSYFGPVAGGDDVKMGDTWLAHVVPVLLSDPDVTVIITFDEGTDSSAQHVYMVEVGAGATPGTVDGQHYDHYGLLAGLYSFFGLGSAPNGAANATPMPIAPDSNSNPDHDLTVHIQGAGTVTSTPGAIACGTGDTGTCTDTFTHGTSVTLTQVPESGSGFVGWSGSCTGTGACVVSMNAAKSVTATFGPLFTLTVDPPTNGSVTSNIGGIDCPGTCSDDFPSGASVTLATHPDAGFGFSDWGGDCDGVLPPTCTLTIDAAKSVSVTFDPVPQHTLTVSTDGTAPGSVTSDVGGIDCPTTLCSADFDEGQVVVLTASPGANASFTGWSGACSGVSSTCNVTMSSPQSATATFDTAPLVTTLDDNDAAVAYNGWTGVVDAGANGGYYRVSNVVNDMATWKSASASSVTWVMHVGPDGGKANVTIDGKSKGTVDLYAPTPGTLSKAYGGLTNKAHTVIVKVLSGKNAASTGRNVSIDAFKEGGGFVSDSDPAVTYNTWAGTASNHAFGGSYRSATANTATVTVTFTGTAIDWIAGKGPNFGKATVKIDGVSVGTVDLYKASAAWQSVFNYGGLSAGPHTLVIQVLGQKSGPSNGTKVLVDGFNIYG